MNKRQASLGSQAHEPPEKSRRTNRACLNCRSRKQKCPAPSAGFGQQAPCSRCQQLSLRCSFEIETARDITTNASPSKVVEYILDLQRRLDSHEQRLITLEGGDTSSQVLRPDVTPISYDETYQLESAAQPSSSAIVQVAMHEHRFDMDHVSLESPFATLRSMRAGVDAPTYENRSHRTEHRALLTQRQTDDVIARGVLTLPEAEKAVEVYFSCSHLHAPFISEAFRNDPSSMRFAIPAVFLGICSIGARFWGQDLTQQAQPVWVAHPQIQEIVALFDDCISRLLLRPASSDISLDTVQALLLYAQWMPCDRTTRDRTSLAATPLELAKSRYNDTSAWTILGLAARYAKLLRMNQEVSLTSQSDHSHDMFPRLRTYYNLISCDFNLMLSSGLPVSIDPTSTQKSMQELVGNAESQLPGDLRIVALTELVSLTYLTLVRCSDYTGRKLDLRALKSLNAEMDRWEKAWISKLANTSSQHNQLPFTSVRWYRLALNSASLAQLFSPRKALDSQQSQLLLLQSLEVCLTSASQIIISHSKNAGGWIWSIESQLASSFPEGPFEPDPEALGRLQYAVDSSWISYTFAVTFIVLCFVRGFIDENLQLRCMQEDWSETAQRSPKVRPESITQRLLCLSLEVCHAMESFSSYCLCHDFRKIIINAASMLGVTSPDNRTETAGPQADMQSMLGLIHESGFEWPGGLFDFTNTANVDWNM
ncbi:hypothetical protein AUEXF2481DRAFT_36596 [Aureobasidium subglaciale EXF-2481]|uniref:Zn(2)-C6 fungal-type domain-containing protein n=1 Tax=Aureobasidium subglaciale (strain EXF-2481) TaxID=1043005 RepID=A0A074YNK8_AURSE|nr:uncharacterized protein AUEXF2481DRAFT_36596 [Aureobasidium subglaciale EXF-2481]KEQ99280.1 hypothetical protein AUEXF2481DRAFT_36596 [Aureobasidium subglaciale EXF-2481]